MESVWLSVRSTSVKATEPVSVRSSMFSPVTPSTISVTPPVVSPEPMIGASFVPVMVTVTVSVSVPPLPSSTVTS